jgi:ABC-2 type transport system permease protein
MAMSMGSLLTLIIPMYFIADALQPVVGEAIATEGGQYFGFVVAGMATFQFVMSAVGALPSAISSGLRTGTFEALLTTPTRIPTLLLGLVSYPIAWSGIRALCMLGVGQMLGADYAFGRILVVGAIWGAIVLAYLPFGILAGAFLLVTRTTGPLPTLVLTGSMLLGGVYYPTHVIPSWLQLLSGAVPLTYGLRALRRVLAAEIPVAAVATDLLVLVALTVVLLAVSMVAFRLSLSYARQSGSLAQY